MFGNTDKCHGWIGNIYDVFVKKVDAVVGYIYSTFR